MQRTITLMEGIDKAVYFLKTHWYSKIGLIVALIFSLITSVTITSSLGLETSVALTLIAIILIALFCYWLFSMKPPKTPKNKIGFLISISSSNEDDARKVKEDLVVPLMQLVKTGKAGKSFHFMELPQHLAERCLDPDQAQLIRAQSGAHFMLFGRMRKRLLDDGKMHHFFDFEGAVAHQPISDQVSKSISAEFSELLPRKVQILPENDLLSFQFTSEWAEIVAKYIIGIAAACSGDIVYAEQLYDDVKQRLGTQNNSFPVFAKLNERLPVRKAEIYEAMATSIHRQWAESKDQSLMSQVKSYLDKIEESQKERPAVNALSAICAIVIDKDVDTAMNFVKKLPQQTYPVWNLNMAFLYGYKGDLKHSIQQYRAAAMLQIEVDTINQVEDFLNWAIKENPEKYQLHYCLGFFNWQIREDSLLAKSNFYKFLELVKPNEFIKENELAKGWIAQIDNSILSPTVLFIEQPAQGGLTKRNLPHESLSKH